MLHRLGVDSFSHGIRMDVDPLPEVDKGRCRLFFCALCYSCIPLNVAGVDWSDGCLRGCGKRLGVFFCDSVRTALVRETYLRSVVRRKIEMTCCAAWNRDKGVLGESTSGGVFSALAEKVVAVGGIVVGAAYDADMNVRHEVVETKAELRRLRGVKYVKGVIGIEVYHAIRKALAAGRKVLFSGLPCQAAAVRRMFGNDANLLVCDLVCFGAPPHALWRKYIDWMEAKRGKKLVNVNPRDKRHGWGRKTYCRYEWEDGQIVRRLSLFDPYAQAFYMAIAFGPACYDCRFKGANSKADITLCDFWGAERLGLSDMILRGGVSGVMVRTERGEKAFAAADVERHEVGFADVVKANYPVLHSAAKPERWSEFAEDMETMDFGELAKKYGMQKTWASYAVGRMRSIVGSVSRFMIKAKGEGRA